MKVSQKGGRQGFFFFRPQNPFHTSSKARRKQTHNPPPSGGKTAPTTTVIPWWNKRYLSEEFGGGEGGRCSNNKKENFIPYSQRLKNLLALPPHPPLWKPILSRHGSGPTAGKTRVWSGVDKIKEKRVKARLLQGSRNSAHLLLASSRHAGRGGDTGRSRKKLQTVRTFLQPHTHTYTGLRCHTGGRKNASQGCISGTGNTKEKAIIVLSQKKPL